MIPEHSLFVGDHDNEDCRDAAEDNDDCQSEESSLCVANSLGSLLHTGYDVWRAYLEDSAAFTQVRLELLVDFQHIPIEKPEIYITLCEQEIEYFFYSLVYHIPKRDKNK